MNVLVIAPHPDDETLGCGGTLLRHKAQGDTLHWLIVTGMTAAGGFSSDRIAARAAEIEALAAGYGFASVHALDLPTGGLDRLALDDIITPIKAVVHAVRAETVYVPFPGDAHSDHAAVFQAASAAVKSFRSPSVRRVLAYETLSETEFGLNPTELAFRPNIFVDIAPYLDDKLRLMRGFAGEMGDFPFPRSETSIRALAALRGGTAGCQAAESFMLLKEIQS